MPIQLDNIVLRRHPALPPVLDGVTLSIERGEAIAVVGANGSGKSTLARVLAGVLVPDSGRLVTAGARVGLVLQDPAAQAIASTVADDVAFGPEGQSMAPPAIVARVTAVLRELELADLAARDPSELSGGQQQRLAIAGVLACDVDLLVLDEPTAHLDAPSRSRLVAHLQAVMDGGATVVWVTQDPADQALCARTVVMDAGAVAWDGPTAAWVQEDALAAALGVELPPAARIAHVLARAGRWPARRAVPVHVGDLVHACVELAGSRGG